MMFTNFLVGSRHVKKMICNFTFGYPEG